MSAVVATATTTGVAAAGRRTPSIWRRLAHNPRVVSGAIIILLLLICAVAAPLLATHDPEKQSLLDRLEPPSFTNLLGTDSYGRDIWSRAVWAARVSLTVALSSSVLAMVFGAALGMLAGYFGGLVDNLLMRFTDAWVSFPTFFLLVTAVTVFGSRLDVLILIIAITAWPVTARLVRGEVLTLKEREFVGAARSLGASDARIILRHLLPNLLSVLTVTATIRVALAILLEAGLSFLGLGVQPPTPSWGNMVAGGYEVLRSAWWVGTLPGLFIFAAVLGMNLVGDGLRDTFDPRMRS